MCGPTGTCRLKPRPAKRRSLISASQSVALGLGRIAAQQPRQPAHRPALVRHAALRRARRAASRSSAASSPSSTPPRAGPLRPSTIAVTTPCSVRMSCCVGCHALEDVAQVDLHGVALVRRAEELDLFQFALQIGEEGVELLLGRRRRFARGMANGRSPRRELEPFIGDDHHRLRQVERGEGRIDRQRDDAVGAAPTSWFSSPLRSRPNTMRDGLAGRDRAAPSRAAASAGTDHGLGLIVRARRGRQHEACSRRSRPRALS